MNESLMEEPICSLRSPGGAGKCEDFWTAVPGVEGRVAEIEKVENNLG